MNDKNVMKAFVLYQRLSSLGEIKREDAPDYMDEEVRGLLSEFASAMDTTVISAGDSIYLIPLTTQSDYHMTNQEIKDKYLPSRAKNIDIYLLYVTVIIFVGEFYDSYQTTQATRDFLTIDGWMQAVDERLDSLKQIEPEALAALEQEYEYNWLGIIDQWDATDIIKEGIKKQTARTRSRKSFLNTVKKFLIEEGLALEIGDEELEITDKTKVIVQWFFMDYEFNRGIMDVIYGYTGLEELSQA